ncbi:MAG: hypothetical protein H0Z18_07170 [Thermococcus sp.]|uniref:hypothetical protein n=1 Tax=Thermococcus sp. TaxID=35749 RepID=UPI001D7928B2|nr:hypothetical protein [Thermococcus sp.]MBO8175022.1 hypothetical protein [Thermococcus sp.]
MAAKYELKNLLGIVDHNENLSIIERDSRSLGYALGLNMLKILIERGEFVWLVLFEPLSVLRTNLKTVGLRLEDLLQRGNFYIFDIYGSVAKIKRNLPHIYQVKGDITGISFVAKYMEVASSALSETLKNLGVEEIERIWTLGFLDSSVGRLFDNPVEIYKRMWLLKYSPRIRPPIKDIRSIIIYNSAEFPKLESFIYEISDYVLESFVVGEDELKHLVVVSKSKKPGLENLVLEYLFDGGENVD